VVRALVKPKGKSTRVVIAGDYPEPSLAGGEALVRVALAGICSTDLEIARGYMDFTGVLGHEFVGTVVSGDERLIGQRVVADINCSCHRCETCRRGHTHHCPRRTVLGIAGRDGAFAEYVSVPARNCHVVPADISDRQAVFVEPLAAAAHVLDVRLLDAEMRVAVLGAGRLGLLVAQVLALHACRLDVIGRNPTTLALCRRWGLSAIAPSALTVERTYDTVVDCTGTPGGFRLAMRICRPCGTIILKSTYADPEAINLAPLVIDEIRVVGSRCGNFPRALSLLEQQQVNVDDLISQTYALKEGLAALDAATHPQNIKVLIRPEHG
jgi:threonine dehydrogenase-like Zn-dependent dehydrogenase